MCTIKRNCFSQRVVWMSSQLLYGMVQIILFFSTSKCPNRHTFTISIFVSFFFVTFAFAQSVDCFYFRCCIIRIPLILIAQITWPSTIIIVENRTENGFGYTNANVAVEGQNGGRSECCCITFISKPQRHHCWSSYGERELYEAFGKWNEIEVNLWQTSKWHSLCVCEKLTTIDCLFLFTFARKFNCGYVYNFIGNL